MKILTNIMVHIKSLQLYLIIINYISTQLKTERGILALAIHM